MSSSVVIAATRTEITTDHKLLIEVESTLTTTICRRGRAVRLVRSM